MLTLTTITLALYALTLLTIAETTRGAITARPLPERLARTITATHECQKAIGQKPTPFKWRKHSRGYRLWQIRVWQARLEACRHQHETQQAIIVQLNSGLRGTPMGGTGKDLYAAARKFRISPFFIAAIAGTESSFGAAACRSNRYNAFGLASCGSSWRVPAFQSWKDAYEFMAKFLTDRWPSATSTYHYYGYAACSSCWGAKTAYHMQARFGVGSNVTYG